MNSLTLTAANLLFMKRKVQCQRIHQAETVTKLLNEQIKHLRKQEDLIASLLDSLEILSDIIQIMSPCLIFDSVSSFVLLFLLSCEILSSYNNVCDLL